MREDVIGLVDSRIQGVAQHDRAYFAPHGQGLRDAPEFDHWP